MSEWGLMSEEVNEWVIEWVRGWMDEGVKEWVNEWLSEWVREWVKALLSECLSVWQRRVVTITVIITIIIFDIIIIIIINQGCNRLLERSVMWFMRAICYWGHSVMSTSSAFCCVCCAMHAKICATCKRSDMYAMYTSGLLLDMLVLPLHRLMGGVC